MRPLSLTQVAAMAGGRVRGTDGAIDVVATDTRALPAGALPESIRNTLPGMCNS